MKKLWVGAALAAAGLLCGRPAPAQVRIVSVTGGRAEGVSADGVTSFKGIPFAAPPVGNLRWRAPQPVKPWKGTKKADHFGPSCMQGPRMLKLFGAPPAMSEDCLYLNVWSPGKSANARLPVMVWIYGGGFFQGTTSMPAYDGAHLARKGVVVVSVSYRLGALGFLADPELSAAGILAVYPHATEAQSSQAQRDVFRDYFFAWRAWSWARLQSLKGKGQAYLYYFDVRTPPNAHGSPHGAEVPYVFDNPQPLRHRPLVRSPRW